MNKKVSCFSWFTIMLLTVMSGNAQELQITMEPIGYDFFLSKPWDLEYGPDDHLWVTERQAGIVVRIDPETWERDELIQINDMISFGGQDGLLGMALHPEILDNQPYVYVSYSYQFQGVPMQKIVRYTYALNGNDGTLSSPQLLIDKLPVSNDHNSGRLIFGPDEKLYYTIGDQGSNQGGNYCKPVLSQELPTEEEINSLDWSNYPGKILRLNPDGSIPEDNPEINGVRSHIFSYGHRNPQGIVFGNNNILYSDEHGPNTDDEVNLISSGMNYGWPNVAGYRDDQAYDYCNWSSASNCSSQNYSYGSCPSSAELYEESSFEEDNYQDPLLSMFAVSDDYNFNDPSCSDSWICRPNVAPSSIAYYGSDAIPSWKNSLLVVSLKRGRIYRLQLNEDGTSIVGDTTQHFYSTNRYRDMVVSPDGKSFFVITDESGKTSDASGLNLETNLQYPGMILKFTVEETVAVKDKVLNIDVNIYPNPAEDILTIDLINDTSGFGKGYIINAVGEKLKVFSINVAGQLQLDINGLNTGIYFLKLEGNKGTYIEKIIIK